MRDLEFSPSLVVAYSDWGSIKVIVPGLSTVERLQLHMLESVYSQLMCEWDNGSDSHNTLLSYLKCCISILKELMAGWDWNVIHPHFRTLYSLFSLLRGYLLLKQDRLFKVLKSIDHGLLFGEPLFNNVLAKIASVVHTKLQEDESPKKCASCDCLSKQAVVEANPSRDLGLIASYDRLGLDTFLSCYFGRRPVLVKGSVKKWPAIKDGLWTIENWSRRFRYRTVPLEIGGSYIDCDWSQRLGLMGDFLKSCCCCCSCENDFNPSSHYLAQHNLFQQFPELCHEISIPDYCWVENPAGQVLRNAWVGPNNTVSPAHTDPYHNIFCQVFGRKRFILVDPSYNQCMYPHDEDYQLHNTSQIDLANPDFSSFPLFRDVPIHECVLEPGDLLYIPPLWWHYVRSLSVSFSVSNWW